jgi:hypothetical protein
MERFVLHTNARPVYGLLSFINTLHPGEEPSQRGKILDCRAGGPVPPVALFAQHGFEVWGIDVSEEELGKAREFCERYGVELRLRTGDMRHTPFEDGTLEEAGSGYLRDAWRARYENRANEFQYAHL